jgi:hypothetical protein
LLKGIDGKEGVVDYRYLASIQSLILLQISYEKSQLGRLKSELKNNFIRLK